MGGSDGCETCSNATTCEKCYDGFTFDSTNRCVAVTDGVGPCATGFYRSDSGDCMQCEKGCKRCNGTMNSCLECFSGEWNQDQTTCGMNCKLSCSAGSNGCYACDAANETCMSCMNGWTYNAKLFTCTPNSGSACAVDPQYPSYFFM